MLWVRFELEGETLEATLEPVGRRWRVQVEGETFDVTPGVPDGKLRVLDVCRRAAAGAGGTGVARAVKAPMAGRLDRVAVSVGQDVKAGEVLFVLEAMKMQNEVRATAAGKVQAVKATAGAALDAGTVVLELA